MPGLVQIRSLMPWVLAVIMLSNAWLTHGTHGSCPPSAAPFLLGTGCPEHASMCAQALSEYRAIVSVAHKENEEETTYSGGMPSTSALRSILDTFCNTSVHWPNPEHDLDAQEHLQGPTSAKKSGSTLPPPAFAPPTDASHGLRSSPSLPSFVFGQRSSLSSPPFPSSSSSSSSTPSSSSSPVRRPRRQEEDKSRPRGSCSLKLILENSCRAAGEETFVITLASWPYHDTNESVLAMLNRAVNDLSLPEDITTLHLSGVEERTNHIISNVDADILHHVLNSSTWSSIRVLELSNVNLLGSFHFPSLRFFTNLRILRTAHAVVREIEYTQLHDELGTIGQHIRSISFVNCGLRSVSPIVFQGLYNLKELDLSINGLSRLKPGQFGDLNQLSAINLSRNRLTRISAESFGSQNNLALLNLDGNRISQIAEAALLHLTNLKQLMLASNRISTLNIDNTLPTSLTSLDLTGNRLGVLVPMHTLSQLRNLRLGQNKLSQITAHALAHMTRLTTLDLGGNQLTHDRVRELLAHTPVTQLRLLNLTNNNIRRIPDNMDKCTSLDTLILRNIGGSDSKLELGDKPLLRAGNNLTTLTLSGNGLTDVDVQVLSDLSRLENLNLADNSLSRLADGLLNAVPTLRVLALDNNKLEQLELCGASEGADGEPTPGDEFVARCPRNARGMLQKLHTLSVGNNRLTSLALAIDSLRALDLRNNLLEKSVDIHRMKDLQFLSLANHRIKEMRLYTSISYENLRELELSASPRLEGGAMFDAVTDLKTPSLSALTLHNMNFSTASLQRVKANSLRKLHIGHPQFNEDTMPIRELCRLLAPDVSELKIDHTSHTQVDLSVCNGTINSYQNIFVTNNSHVTAVRVPTDVHILNLAANPKLERIAVPKAETLDVSGTNLWEVGELCDTLGTARLFMRDMQSSILSSQNVSVQDMLKRCVLYTQLLDLSDNNNLNEPEWLQTILPTVEITQQATGDGDNRNLITLLVMDDMPVTCTLSLNLRQQPNDVWSTVIEGNDDGRGTAAAAAARTRRGVLEEGLVRSALTYQFECSCVGGYMKKNGRCRSIPYLEPGTIAGIVLGIVLLNATVWLVYERHFKRIRSLTQDSLLKQRLLSERDEEVLQLRSAWRVDEEELRFVKRISHGASGDVYQAWWDNLKVAVKVLKNVDSLHLGDFEKELDFLQRTRHQNLVRFFGAGERADSTPFVVLEYVSFGSLHHLLSKDLDVVVADALTEGERSAHPADFFDLASYAEGGNDGADSAYNTRSRRGTSTSSRASQRPRGMSMLRSHDMSIAETEELVHVVATPSTGTPKTAWELKLALLQDVVSGMAFIHTLGHVHRDLKSANVLVSATLRAKIADFGTIKLSQQSGSNRSSGFFSAWQPSLSEQQGVAGTPQSHTQVDHVVNLNMTRGVGTLLYMAPEVLECESYDSAVDVFSFGVLMWEVATQRMPDIIAQEVRDTVRGPESGKILQLLNEGKRLKFPSNSGIPQWYQDMYAQCTALAPDERPYFWQLQEQLNLRRRELTMTTTA